MADTKRLQHASSFTRDPNAKTDLLRIDESGGTGRWTLEDRLGQSSKCLDIVNIAGRDGGRTEIEEGTIRKIPTYSTGSRLTCD